MKKLQFILILAICLLSSRAFTQPVETNYPGTLIANGPLNPIPLDNDGPFPIKFDFTFYGITYTEFWVSENGRLMFTEPASPYSTPATIPTAALPNNYIAAFWDNLTISSTGNVLYKTIGAAPNRKLVVQFRNMMFVTPASFLGTFSIILYESTNVIQFQYRQIIDNASIIAHGSRATIGLENSDGTSGTLYAFQNPTAVANEQAISFTPGTPYTINSNAVYDGIYLTSNETLPEPGITPLTSPPQDAVVGTAFTFQWSESTNASSYTLLLATSPDLGGATILYTGSNLLFNITGLVTGTTYYWGVFATNSTSTTWCQIRKFSVSATPLLAAVPQTIWAEQTQNKQITLAYTGGDASAKTAKITSLPAEGKLYQYNAGVPGTEITAPLPVTVTDASRNIFYSATGGSGNGVGNFNYVMNDAGGDSPAALITINVSPPGIPNVLNVAKGSNYVEVQFDIAMADPAGKESQFTVTSNGTPVAVTSAAFKTGDNNTYILNTAALTDPVTVAYTQGAVTSSAGGVLLTFSAQPVTLTAQTITFAQSLDLKYNNFPFTFTATASSALGLTYSSSNLSVVSVSGSTASFVGLGSSDITARQAGSATFAPARLVKTMTIAKGDQTISFTLPTKTYGDADFTLSATTTSGLPISYSSDNTDVATVTGNAVHIVSAGSAVITASQAGNSLWNSATNPQTLTVNKATLTVTADPKSKAYGAANPPLTFTYSGWVAGVETIDTPPTASTTVTISSPPAVYPGAITLSGGLDNNYLFSFVPADFTVTKADQTITFGPLANGEVGSPDYSPGATASSGLAVTYTSDNTAVATITAGGLIHIVAKGTAVITASQAGDDNYNAAPTVPQTLVVDKAVSIVDYSGSPGSASSWYNEGSLYIKCPADMPETDGKLTIYDMNGRPLLNFSEVKIIPGETISTSVKLSKGIYVVMLKAGVKEQIMRVVVM